MKKQKTNRSRSSLAGPLAHRTAESPSSESGEVVKFEESGMPQLEVWLEDETVWLTQNQMAELFGCAVANINAHLRHIYADGELEEVATIKDFLIVRFEGNRSVTRSVMPPFKENRRPIGFN